jgi:hypothetical protein
MMISTNEQRNSATFEKDGPGKVPVPMSLFVVIWFITKKDIEFGYPSNENNSSPVKPDVLGLPDATGLQALGCLADFPKRLVETSETPASSSIPVPCFPSRRRKISGLLL